MRHKIIIGDSKKMDFIENNSIHLIVTSPPYGSIKKYSNIEEDIGNYNANTIDFWNRLNQVFIECYRILQPNRRFCLNVANIPEAERMSVFPFKCVFECEKIGFVLKETIIWQKLNYRSNPFLGSIPPSPVMANNFEYIFVFQKKGKADYSHVSKEQKEESKKQMPLRIFTKIKDCVWRFEDVKRTGMMDEHLAQFPYQLPERLIKLYSFVGEIVLDPFLGSGTTTQVARDLKRNSIGIELNPDFLEMIKNKIGYGQQQINNENDYEIINESKWLIKAK